MIQQIRLDLIDAHPDNPRIAMREGVIAAIQAQLAGREFDDMHAILLRPLGERFQTLDGHHRVEAARREGFEAVPAWVREYSDEEAFMQLALANAQSGLTALERGRHALAATTRYGADGGISIAKYAERVAAKEQTTRQQIWAYEVFAKSKDIFGLDKRFAHLVAIHAAPREEWKALAQEMVERAWTVEQTEAAARAAKAARKKIEDEKPAITSVPLEEWKKLKPAARKEILDWRARQYHKQLNRQDSDSIEWADWSWNPVTGCLHNCPYCYARDLAERFYPEKFAPVLHVDRLVAPSRTAVPATAARDISMKNVFTCSMADLFGQWVPREWIEAVLEVVAENPQWNFLFLTKFPIRMAEFEYPPNAWLGTTVDLQARVKNAERAMANVKATVKWLSLEPLIDPLQFENLGAFQWVVIGGASPSSQTPEWKPPRRWVWELTIRAMDAGCLVYHKANLSNDRLKMFPGETAAEQEPAAAPAEFHYLKVLSA